MLCLVTVVVATVIGILHWTAAAQDYAGVAGWYER